MRYLLCTAIGGQYGMGHASRMRALGQTLAARGAEVLFVTKTPALAEHVAPLPCVKPYAAAAQLTEQECLIFDCLEDVPFWPWRARLRVEGHRLVLIGSLPHDQEWDLVVLPHMHTAPEVRERVRGHFGARLLCGADYVMLPSAITETAALAYGDARCTSIVFCAGGSDPDAMLLRMHAWMADCLPGVAKVFLYGQYSMYPAPASRDGTVCITFALRYVQHAPLVVSTFGQTVYECLYWRTPALVFGHTDAHCAAAAAMQAVTRGAVQVPYQHDLRTMDAAYFRDQVAQMWDLATRTCMHHASAGLLDGHGVARVADAIMELHG